MDRAAHAVPRTACDVADVGGRELVRVADAEKHAAFGLGNAVPLFDQLVAGTPIPVRENRNAVAEADFALLEDLYVVGLCHRLRPFREVSILPDSGWVESSIARINPPGFEVPYAGNAAVLGHLYDSGY